MKDATYVLIQAESGSDPSDLAERVASLPFIAKAVRVGGPYDVIAEVREQPETEPSIATLRSVEGVLRAIPLPVVAMVPSPSIAA